MTRRPGFGDARAVVGAAAVLAALGGVAVVAWPQLDSNSQIDSGPPTEVILVPTETLPPVVPLDTGTGTGSAPVAVGPRIIQTVESSIGTITWTRVDGDSSSLPLRITGSRGEVILGADDADVRWTSSDGSHWQRERDDGNRRIVGGVSWVQRTVDGERLLSRVTAGGEISASVDTPTTSLLEGFAATTELVGPADGFPIVLDGGMYVLSNVRTGLPWAKISGSEPDAHRVQVAYGERLFTSVAGDFHEMPVTKVEMSDSSAADNEFVLVDAESNIVWTLRISPDAGLSPIEGIRDRTSSQWLAWEDQRFIAVDTPWPSDHEVDVVAIDDAVVARSQAAHGKDVALWHTSDGRVWERVPLPHEASTDSPVAMFAGDDELIFTIWIDDAPTYWSTVDGLALVRLPDIPGITARSRGSFGWIAPDPRSAPTIRVSPNGEDWEAIDVSDVVGYDASYWDLTVRARAVGSKILIVAERQGNRTLLVGQVVPSS